MQNWLNPNLIANSAGSMGPAGPVLAVMLVAVSGVAGIASPLFSYAGPSPDRRGTDLLEAPALQAPTKGAAQMPILRFALAPASPDAPLSKGAADSFGLIKTVVASADSNRLDTSTGFEAPAGPMAPAAIPLVAFSPGIDAMASKPQVMTGAAGGQAAVQTADPGVQANEPFALLASAVSHPPVQASASTDMQGVHPSLNQETEPTAGYASAARSNVQASAQIQSDNPDSHYKYGARGIQFDVAAKVNGVPVGKVPLLIADGENFSVRLADVLAAVEPILDKSVYATLSASKNSDEYVTLNTLRASGIAVGFDANDQLIFGSK